MVEYALMVALIALVCMGGVKVLGGATGTQFSRQNSMLSEAGAP